MEAACAGAKTRYRVAVALVFVCVAAASLAQVPPAEPADDGCLRHDYAAARQRLDALASAIEQGNGEEILDETNRRVRGCMAFEVSFRSSLTIRLRGGEGPAVAPLVQTVTATGRVIVELTPGLLQDAGHDFASNPRMVRAPVVWSGVSIRGGVCSDYDIVPSPPTPFAFWLGVDVGATPKASLVVVPDGGEAHVVRARCHGHWGIPQPQPIFSPVWTAIHTGKEGNLLDDYFKFEMAGTTGRAVFARHDQRRVERLPGGQGEVDEHTTIVVIHAPSVR